MDEALEAAELVQEAGLEGAFAWLFRIVGLVLILAGIGFWLFTEMGILWIPAVLVVAGLILVAVPEVLLALLELAG